MIEFIGYRENMLKMFTSNEKLWEIPRDFDEKDDDFIYLYSLAKDIEFMSKDEIEDYIKTKTKNELKDYINLDDCIIGGFIVEINKELKPKTKRRKTIDITLRCDLLTIIYSFGYIGS